MNILAISGSLRANSSNERLLLAAAKLAPAGIKIQRYEGLASLPFYNPDLDTDHPPKMVKEFRTLIGNTDGLLISSPEYAHGIPGALKNALDWLVASTEFPGKFAILICGGEFAPVQLKETLQTMSAKVLHNIIVYGPTLRKAFDDKGALVDENLAAEIKSALVQLVG